jgi:transglutaminase/protease-like cytokinesis protein 3
MARPKPTELLVKFFPELIDKSVSSSNKEASKELNVRICEAIISDLIGKFDSLMSYMGEGALIVKLASRHGKPNIEKQNYINKFSLEQDLKEAQKEGDTTVIEFLKDVLAKVNKCKFDEEICILLLDNSGGSAAIIPRDHPAKRIQAMMDEI